MDAPIPSPRDLANYNQIAPGFAERIIQMAEREAAARQDRTKKELEFALADHCEARRETMRGQWMAFVVTLVAFGVAVYCASINQVTVASVVAGTTLVSVVSTLINRKSKGR